MKAIACLMLFLVVLSSVSAQQSGKYPAPKYLGDPATLGLGIQRTMTLLATSAPGRRNTVKILFYGQSITEQNWWNMVAEDLKRRFPNANLVIENRALGGYASQLLVKAAETDLYSFYPDLMIFYVYGSHIEYENIIRRTRERTTAEILIQTDHVTADENLTEETDPAKIYPSGKIWNSFMNYRFLPELAKKYHCGLVDQRNLWKQYLKDIRISARDLLRDGVHLNEHGCYLMGELIKAYLVKRNDSALDPMNCGAVKTFVVGQDIRWENGKIKFSFEGNRVDVITKEATAQPASVRIDGKKPSELPELYGFTRALPCENGSERPRGKWPAVMDIATETLAQLEDWTVVVTKDPAKDKLYAFTLKGSKTGEDGEGRSDQCFVSKSRRIIIEPDDWQVDFALGLTGLKPVPPKLTIRWQVVPLFSDVFNAPIYRQKGTEAVVTVAQGLKNTRHTLEIIGGSETSIPAIRVYRPMSN